MGKEKKSYASGGKKNKMQTKEGKGYDGNHDRNDVSGRQGDYQNTSSYIRKQVDPETQKYFLEIANLFESSEVDVEQRSVICGNALDETRGKELELATDYIISHTLQTLIEGCDIDRLCDFLQNCSKYFSYIAMDKSGSHVAESAFNALNAHLEDDDARPAIEEALTNLCQVIVTSPFDMMCNCYGSHVLRRLLCLCKGVPLDSSEFHSTKSSTVLAKRFNFKEPQLDEHNKASLQKQGFPNLLKLLVNGMLKASREDILSLLVDQYSSLVLQTAVKLLDGDDQALMHIIPILLGCTFDNIVKEDGLKSTVTREIIDLMKEGASTRLMEVILEVAPEALYNGLLKKVFKKNLFRMSTDNCGNFVVQALISHAKSVDQMELIWEELGSKFKELLEMGRSGVAASLIASSQRLQTHEHQCCKALSDAVCSASDSPGCVVPRILFLENFFCCQDKSNWKWPSSVKINVMGSLILQAVFRYQRVFNLVYIDSLISMEAEHIFQMTKDASGARVVEAFLISSASGKIKRKIIVKLQGYFGELSLHPASSFAIEKCFLVSNITLKEVIVSELLTVRSELYRTRHGPHILRELDVAGYSANPDQWRSRQASKRNALEKIQALFGPNKTKTSQKAIVQNQTDADVASLVKPNLKRCSETTEPNEKLSKVAMNDDVSKRKSKKAKKRND